MPVLQDNKSPIEKIVHEPKDNYMLKLYFFVSESEIHVLFNEVQPEVFKDFYFFFIFTLLNCGTLKAILHNAQNKMGWFY